MAGQDDSSEKTHAPTQKRIDDARKRGEIAKSDEVTTLAVFAGLFLAGIGGGALSLTHFGAELAVFLSHADSLTGRVLAPGGRGVSAQVMSGALLALSPLLLIPFGLAVASLLAQRAFVFAPTKLMPKIQRISPISGAKNKFGLSGMVEFAKKFVKLLVVAILVVVIIYVERDIVIGSVQGTAPGVVVLIFILLERFFLAVVVLSMVIAVLDMSWVQFDHERKLKMSHQDIKDEAKESDGDPALKARRRQRGTEIANNKMLADVPAADVVIVNPTHYAVALKWTRAPGSAPECVAKGTDHMAARIRDAAAASGVPIHSDPPTARALHATIEVGQQISPDHYRAVAAAIRFSDQMRAKARAQPWSTE